jgi:hypothetical protein
MATRTANIPISMASVDRPEIRTAMAVMLRKIMAKVMPVSFWGMGGSRKRFRFWSKYGFVLIGDKME